MKKQSSIVMIAMMVLAMVFNLAPVPAQAAAPTDLFFSEYIEGSSNNKALEIYNGTGAAIDLSADGYNVQMFFNGSATAGLTINLTGTVANGDVFVVAHSSASATILAQADQTNGAGWFNGNDAVVLRKGTAIIDAIGQVGFNPGTEWGTGLISTADNTLRRLDSICTGDPNSSDVFDPSMEWSGFATDTFDGLGSHVANCAATDSAPYVVSTLPADGAIQVALDSNLNVLFSEPVNAVGSWLSLTCSASGAHTMVIMGGPSLFIVDPMNDFESGETCTVTVYASNVRDQDTDDPPDNMEANFTFSFTTFIDYCTQPYTPIYDIQGSGESAAITGLVTTQGVVVGDYEVPSGSGQIRGFYIQDLTGDGNPATSDGIFVFNGNNDSVNLGEIVRVTGTASEFQAQTQVSASSLIKCGTGSVAPVDVILPFSEIDFPERYEGMLVRLPQTLYVTEHYLLGRFGQVLMSSGGRLQQPTNVVLPGAPAQALQEQNNLNRIIIDDGTNVQNPDPIVFGRGGLPLSASNTLRGGDTATGTVGVMTYNWGGASASPNAYRVRPINALNGFVYFEPANPRPDTAPVVGGSLKVVGMNLLNFFNTFDGSSSNPPYACNLGVGGALTDCRGADDAGEFARQYPKTVAAILAMDPDILGFNEIENDGYGLDSAIQFLVDQLNAETAPGTYAFIDVDAATGQLNALGVDAIKVGMIYKPAVVTPVGQTAVLNTIAFVNGGDSGARSRPSLAQAFQVNTTGARFIVNINHLKSKGSACDLPDAGDGQGNCNQVRVNAATELMSWFATDPTGTGDPDILMIGDYNSYAFEDPITVIKNAGFTNLIESFLGPDAYSYVFDGQWGYLDHALGSASIVDQVTGVGDYHINADEPSVLDYNDDFKSAGQLVSLYAPDQFRVSDHDAVVVGLDLVNYPPELGEISVTPDVVAVGAPVDAYVPFTDPDALDMHSAVWDWGDGTTSAGTVAEFFGAGTISGSHSYAKPGIYTVQVAVWDNYGNSDSASYEYVFVYDPNGKFITGGGWIDSPAGAYVLDPLAAGKAEFSFDAKYLKNMPYPVGDTSFYFNTSGLMFTGTGYEWLVVDGNQAWLHGTGMLNGNDGYSFLLTALDGSKKSGDGVDYFRIQIWDMYDMLVYDNQLGDSMIAPAMTPLGGGSINFHIAMHK